MEIIGKAKPKKEKTYTIVCGSCETKFRFVQSEAKYISDQRDGDYLEVKCPSPDCGEFNNVDVGLGVWI